MPGPVPSSIDAYIKEFPPPVADILTLIRKTIAETLPEATECISYGMPTFDCNGKHLVHFAAFKNHIGFYPTPQGITAFERELAPYKRSKGTVQFPLDAPIPYELIRKIALARRDDVCR